MITSRSLFVVPCYYTGTSFERIFSAISHVIDNNNLPIDILSGPKIDNTLAKGALDDAQYTLAQSKIMTELIELLSSKDYNNILFIDFFNPGVELIRYFSEQTGRDIKISALLHGGTFIEGDIFESEWVEKSERLWASVIDKAFIPSQYAYSQLPRWLVKKFSVHPWGMDNIVSNRFSKPYDDRSIDVIFPHRLNSDKGVDDLATIAKNLPAINFVVTTPSLSTNVLPDSLGSLKNISLLTCISTDDLHTVMGDSKIVLSCAKQELFGYSVAEATTLECIPVVPRNQVYSELYDDNTLYSGIDEAISLIEKNLKLSRKPISCNITTSFLPLLREFIDMNPQKL